MWYDMVFSSIRSLSYASWCDLYHSHWNVIPITPTGMAPRSMELGCSFITWISGTQGHNKNNHIAYNTLCINYHIVTYAQQEQIRRL